MGKGKAWINFNETLGIQNFFLEISLSSLLYVGMIQSEFLTTFHHSLPKNL